MGPHFSDSCRGVIVKAVAIVIFFLREGEGALKSLRLGDRCKNILMCKECHISISITSNWIIHKMLQPFETLLATGSISEFKICSIDLFLVEFKVKLIIIVIYLSLD